MAAQRRKSVPNPEKFAQTDFYRKFPLVIHMTWIPFSTGPRNCIGQKLALMELLTVTSTILRRYTVESLDPRDHVLPTLTFALASSVPLRVRIRPRHSKEN
ncbi:hypothetical protein AVEN_188460-1 [Araneus ventricosus]|uniref:Cytochrome P450 4V2 n=1 Tax=Araneus ventricosus TaxID=182803 RepID=A0A4Y2QFX0_ARAVE|nr:hypothetical protein AVEN_188460-1 [Araneus ventricosus]